jgi:hypothetical protein
MPHYFRDYPFATVAPKDFFVSFGNCFFRFKFDVLYFFQLDLFVSCAIEGQKQKTHTQHVPAVPSPDMLGESTLLEEDAKQYDTEYRWNDDLLFVVPSLQNGKLSLKLMSSSVMSKTCHGEATYDISNLDRSTASSVAAPKRKVSAAVRQKLQAQAQDAEAPAQQPQLPTVSLFRGWIKGDDKRVMFFVFISVTRAAGIPTSPSKKDSNVRTKTEYRFDIYNLSIFYFFHFSRNQQMDFRCDIQSTHIISISLFV